VDTVQYRTYLEKHERDDSGKDKAQRNIGTSQTRSPQRRIHAVPMFSLAILAYVAGFAPLTSATCTRAQLQEATVG